MKQLPLAILLQGWKRGRIAKGELEWRLVQAAASAAPEELAPFLSTEQLGALRTLAASPPRSLHDTPRIFVMGGMATDQEREERQLWYDGIRRWHQFFDAPTSETG
jgi:hypothetical protein